MASSSSNLEFEPLFRSTNTLLIVKIRVNSPVKQEGFQAFRSSLSRKFASSLSTFSEIVDQESVIFVIKEVEKEWMLWDVEKPYIDADFIHFSEKAKLDILTELNYARILSNLKHDFCYWLGLDLNKTSIKLKYSHFKDHNVLIDWRDMKPFIGSIPVHSQSGLKICWARALGDWLGINLMITKDGEEYDEGCACSQMDLLDWVYSMQELYKVDNKGVAKITIDDFGFYPCNTITAINHSKDYGVSLLENYGMKMETRKLEFTQKNVEAFNEMRRKRGPRLFPTGVEIYRVVNLKSVVRSLNFGVTIGSMKVCTGCKRCVKFRDFNGKGIYTFNLGYKFHNLSNHCVLILAAGIIKGFDVVNIRNSHGINWGIKGHGNIDLRLFNYVVGLRGVEKRSWSEQDKEWI